MSKGKPNVKAEIPARCRRVTTITNRMIALLKDAIEQYKKDPTHA